MIKRIELPPVRSAYICDGQKAPLINISARSDPERRSVRGQREQGAVNNAFTRFACIDRAERERHNTNYDRHRHPLYAEQVSRLESRYAGDLAGCQSLLDVGCGSGKLMRKIAKVPDRLAALMAGTTQMRMLGLDCNTTLLAAATLKMQAMFAENPGLESGLAMELLQMDLIDLAQLDLRRTCIGESKVDVVLATDIIYWIRKSEREELLRAIRRKLKDTGYLISMELSSPTLKPLMQILGKKFAKELSELSEQKRDVEELKRLIQSAGFEYLAESDTKEGWLRAPFPTMVSYHFRPR